MGEFIRSLETLSDVWIYIAIFFIAYIENIFPPIPSDLVIVFGGSLTGLDRIDFGLTLLFATLGSMLGFVTMYSIGYRFGRNIVETERFRFISPENIAKVKSWFHSYGYWLIVGNRFLPGSRAVISFFAGFSHLKIIRTSFLCFLSALLWNGMLVYAGNILGHNWQQIGFYLKTHSQTVTAILLIFILFLIGRYLYRKTKKTIK